MDKQKTDTIKFPQGKGAGFEILKNVTVAIIKASIKKTPMQVNSVIRLFSHLY